MSPLVSQSGHDPNKDQSIRGDLCCMPQVTHLNLSGPMQDWEMRRQNAHKRAATRDHGRRLHRPDPGPRKDFTTGGKLLIRGYVLYDNRAALAKRSRACADVCEVDLLEEIQELVAKAGLRLDREIPHFPVH